KRPFHEIAIACQQPVDMQALLLRTEAQMADREIGEDPNRSAEKCRQLYRQSPLVAQATNGQVPEVSAQPGNEVYRKTTLRLDNTFPQRKRFVFLLQEEIMQRIGAIRILPQRPAILRRVFEDAEFHRQRT